MEKNRIDKQHLHRWLTAAVALPLLAIIIALGPGWLLLTLVILVTAGGMIELLSLLAPETKSWVRIVTLATSLLLPLATYWQGILGLSTATVVVIFVTLTIHLLLYAKEEAILQSLGALVFAQLYIPFLLSHVLLLFQVPSGRRWIFFLFFVIFAGDTGAYYAGHRLGRHKLWPAVSPGKTVEGAVGGLLSSLATALLVGKLLLSLGESGITFLLFLGLVIASVGQMGDLMESMIKRVSKVKDASSILPGHGGLLDRLDSLIFAFPLTYYGVVFFG
ncbi:MAG: phosphatidate cytidylyltransferase [Deltaproteobacteria bacterium]|nr:phosphatidate cytidylyltransferase [Deltaproteobacteria bacterium]